MARNQAQFIKLDKPKKKNEKGFIPNVKLRIIKVLRITKKYIKDKAKTRYGYIIRN